MQFTGEQTVNVLLTCTVVHSQLLYMYAKSITISRPAEDTVFGY